MLIKKKEKQVFWKNNLEKNKKGWITSSAKFAAWRVIKRQEIQTEQPTKQKGPGKLVASDKQKEVLQRKDEGNNAERNNEADGKK